MTAGSGRCFARALLPQVYLFPVRARCCFRSRETPPDLVKSGSQQWEKSGAAECLFRAVNDAGSGSRPRRVRLVRDFQDLCAVIITTNQGARSAIPHQVENLSCRTGLSRTRGPAKLVPGTERRRIGRGIARASENLRKLRLLLVSQSRRAERLLQGL
jgi:hypothetical protein